MTKGKLNNIVKDLEEVQDIINTNCRKKDCYKCEFNVDLNNGFTECKATYLDRSIVLLKSLEKRN